jgi:predicted ester cyclase
MNALRERWDAAVVVFNAGQVEQVAEDYAEDAEWITPRETYTGRGAILERLRADLAALPDRQINTLRCTEQGDTLVVEYQFVGTHTGPWPMPDGGQLAPTGRPVTFPVASVFTFAAGKITEHRMYHDRLSLLTQLGLLPTR